MSGAISGNDRAAFNAAPDFAALIRATTNKVRKWNAERRKRIDRATQGGRYRPHALRARRALKYGARSPLGVPPRLSLGGCHLPTQLQARLPETGGSGRSYEPPTGAKIARTSTGVSRPRLSP